MDSSFGLSPICLINFAQGSRSERDPKSPFGNQNAQLQSLLGYSYFTPSGEVLTSFFLSFFFFPLMGGKIHVEWIYNQISQAKDFSLWESWVNYFFLFYLLLVGNSGTGGCLNHISPQRTFYKRRLTLNLRLKIHQKYQVMDTETKTVQHAQG